MYRSLQPRPAPSKNNKCPTWCLYVIPILLVVMVVLLSLLIARLVKDKKKGDSKESQDSQDSRPSNLNVPAFPVPEHEVRKYKDANDDRPQTYAEAFNSKKQVVDCDEKAFRDLIQNKKQTAVVAFVADFCGWCKQLVPEFKKAATMARLPFYMVEHGKAGQLIGELGITGFPAVLKFDRGVMIKEYSGDRTAQSLAEFGDS